MMSVVFVWMNIVKVEFEDVEMKGVCKKCASWNRGAEYCNRLKFAVKIIEGYCDYFLERRKT